MYAPRTLVLVALALLLSVAPHAAAAPSAQLTRQQIVDAADAQLATLWAGIQSREATYFAAHGRYAQLLVTHAPARIPVDGGATVPDVGTAVPSYQDSTTAWPASIRTASLRFAIAIHEYLTPDGIAGYQAFVYVVVAGHLVSRSAQVGPEDWRGYGWQDLGPWPPVAP